MTALVVISKYPVMPATTVEALLSLLSPEAIGVISSIALLAGHILCFTLRVGARFKEHELRELQMQERLKFHDEEIERISKHLSEHYCLSHEEARKFLHYHLGNLSDLRHN